MSKLLTLENSFASVSSTHRWTLADYHAMIAAGVLNSTHRVELLFGKIIDMHPVGVAHAQTVDKIVESFIVRFVGQNKVVRGQNPVTLPNASEPEPDICVASGPRSQYNGHHPYPEDILLLIEVADSTLKSDRGIKKLAYAVAGVIEYWVVDVYGRKVEQYTEPDTEAADYAKTEIFREGDTIESVALGAFKVADLMVQYP